MRREAEEAYEALKLSGLVRVVRDLDDELFYGSIENSVE